MFRRTRSVAASRMTVTRHVPLHRRVALLAAAALAGAAVALAAWHFAFGEANADRASLAERAGRLEAELGAERSEKKRWAAIASATDSQLRIEKTTAERLADQIRTLESDNARLKSDLAYLESLMPAAESDQPLAIRRFQVESDGGPLAIRYRALLSQGGRGEKDFSGTFQLVVTLAAEGKVATMTLPDPAGPPESRESMKLSFRRYQRIEGRFDVPVGQAVKSVQLRVLERGVVRAQQTASP